MNDVVQDVEGKDMKEDIGPKEHANGGNSQDDPNGNVMDEDTNVFESALASFEQYYEAKIQKTTEMLKDVPDMDSIFTPGEIFLLGQDWKEHEEMVSLLKKSKLL